MNSKYRFGEPNVVMENEKKNYKSQTLINNFHRKKSVSLNTVLLNCYFRSIFTCSFKICCCAVGVTDVFFGWWTTNNQLISICFFLLKLINSKIKICTNSFYILWAHSVNVESFRNSINKLLHPYIRREQQILIVS